MTTTAMTLSSTAALALLLGAVGALVVLVARRRAAERPDGASEPPEVRSLRLQVETLTQTLTSLAQERPATTSDAHPVAVRRSEPVGAARAADAAEQPSSDPYELLSRSLAQNGRLAEAALAQWAADLRRLAPHVGARGAELGTLIEALSSSDPGTAVVEARAAASALVAPGVVVDDLLGSAAHLHCSPHGQADGSAPEHPAPHQEDWRTLLPAAHVAALEATLAETAALAGDTQGVTVRLRHDLARHTIASGTSAADPTRFVHEVVEPHERPLLDRALRPVFADEGLRVARWAP